MSTEAVAVETRVVSARRPAFAGSWLLSAAMVMSGVLTLAFHVLAARSLGAEAYGQIAVLWGFVFICAIVLFRPIEQTMSRGIADRLARGESPAQVLRSVGALCVALLVAGIAAGAAAWSPISHRLFLGNNVLTAMLLAGTASYGVSYLARGLIGGARWFPGYGLVLMIDAGVRLAVAAPLLFMSSQNLAAAAIVVAALAGGAVPLWVGRRRLPATFSGGRSSEFRLGSALAFAGPAGLIAAADQLLVNGSPLLVRIDGSASSKAVGVVFAATMLVRAPVYVFQGLAASLLPNFTRLQAVGEAKRFTSSVIEAGAVLGLIGVVMIGGAGLVGPRAMTVFGSDFHAGRGSLMLLGAGVTFYLVASVFSQALLSLDRATRAAIPWVVTAVLFVIVYTLSSGDPLLRVSAAIAISTLVNMVALGAALLGKRPGS
ncbi:MAG: lipopolysaccharide biosynthesis protein [Gaiellaceae bacterium]